MLSFKFGLKLKKDRMKNIVLGYYAPQLFDIQKDGKYMHGVVQTQLPFHSSSTRGH